MSDKKGGTGLAIGGFDIGVEVVENRIQLSVLEKIVNKLIQHSSLKVDQSDINQLRKEAVEELNEEYPDLGVERQ
jgi:hypothetical protein